MIDLLDIINNGPGGFKKKGIFLCIIPINCALQPIDSRAKYGTVLRIRISIPNADPDPEGQLNTDPDGSATLLFS